jgi:hypothetical protein
MSVRRTAICAVVCALLASALTTWAPAGASQRSLIAGARAQERYYMSFGTSGATDAALRAAKAQERYYASYGTPRPLHAVPSPEPSDGTPWLPITLAVAGAVAIVAAFSLAARRVVSLRRLTRAAS